MEARLRRRYKGKWEAGVIPQPIGHAWTTKMFTPERAEHLNLPWREWCMCAVAPECVVHDLMHAEV